MNTILLIFFVIPLAVIIVSIALQRLLRCPPLVAAIIFVIFLIVAVILNNFNVLILAIIFAILAYITAVLSCIICRILRENPRWLSCTKCCDFDDRRRNNCRCCERNNNENNNTNNNIATLNTAVSVDDIDMFDTVELVSDNNFNSNVGNSGFNNNNCNNNNCGCNSGNDSNNFVAQARIIPNRNTNGRSGFFRGCYRRR